MSNRTLVELNHDYCPQSPEAVAALGQCLVDYMRSGDPKCLPRGVTYKHMRHHSDKDPMLGYGDPS
jgi:hypothetical protein